MTDEKRKFLPLHHQFPIETNFAIKKKDKRPITRARKKNIRHGISALRRGDRRDLQGRLPPVRRRAGGRGPGRDDPPIEHGAAQAHPQDQAGHEALQQPAVAVAAGPEVVQAQDERAAAADQRAAEAAGRAAEADVGVRLEAGRVRQEERGDVAQVQHAAAGAEQVQDGAAVLEVQG